MKPTRIVVSGGVSVNRETDKTWMKVEYEVEMALEGPGELEVAKAELTALIRGWLEAEALMMPMLATAPAAPAMDGLESLPWKTYRTREPCKPDEAGWIFSNTKGTERLLEALKDGKGAPVPVGGWVYRLSGDQEQFIGRQPVKKGQAR